MRGILVGVVLGIFLVSCGAKEDEFVLSEREDDIHEIISVIVKKDSSYREVKVLSSLKKIDILFDENEYMNEDDVLSIPDYDRDTEIPLKRLTNQDEEVKLFSELDLKYLASQNKNPDSIYLNKGLLEGLEFIEFKELKVYLEERGFNYPSFVELSIPLFSKDNTIAFVQEGYHCGGVCGSGYEYILKKIDGKWVIVEFWQSWMS